MFEAVMFSIIVWENKCDKGGINSQQHHVPDVASFIDLSAYGLVEYFGEKTVFF